MKTFVVLHSYTPLRRAGRGSPGSVFRAICCEVAPWMEEARRAHTDGRPSSVGEPSAPTGNPCFCESYTPAIRGGTPYGPRGVTVCKVRTAQGGHYRAISIRGRVLRQSPRCFPFPKCRFPHRPRRCPFPALKKGRQCCPPWVFAFVPYRARKVALSPRNWRNGLSLKRLRETDATRCVFINWAVEFGFPLIRGCVFRVFLTSPPCSRSFSGRPAFHAFLERFTWNPARVNSPHC